MTNAAAVPPPRDLIRMHVEALFTHDARGRMLRVNEPEGARAPRFFLGRTAQSVEWRVRHDVDDGLARELAAACEGEPLGDEALAPVADPTRFERLLARAAPVERTWAGPAYRFPPSLPAAPDAVLVTPENADVLRPHLAPWIPDVMAGRILFARLIDRHAVSVCCSVRVAAAHEAGVETAPEHRGRGHAVPVVIAWARAVERAGAVPLYSTSWENAASRALARKIGLAPYGSTLHVT